MSNSCPQIAIGYRVGMLTVEAKTGRKKNGYTVWRCRCDCSGEIELDTRYLQRGTITDCGCKTKVRPGMLDLSGKRFGKLTAVRRTDQMKHGSAVWLCRCDCGKETAVSEYSLISGNTKSCGCLKSPDRTGQRFGSLVVVGRSEKRGKRGSRTVPLWECRCDCGATVYRAMDSLTTFQNCSCGQCLNQSKPQKMRKYAGFYEGTQISRINDMTPTAANTSGVRGVHFDNRSGRWVARLKFKRRTYYLGSYTKIEDAAKARAQAEEDIFESYLEGVDLSEIPLKKELVHRY